MSTEADPEFLRRLRHDLRSDINGVLLCAELLKLKLEQTQASADISAGLDRILEHCNRMSARLDTDARPDGSDATQ